ncbi:hypothetical protein CKM354_001099700 [Cercospora kikuchii]|uniref:Uncharacterized protein n=1 Tax=Cercospora kikuchii TaxID=84275 RepID=A0A9P3CXV2_9PEZI|nr:uncharacterized protein CKM354_001099700 [Cercospora kikuchii]GIZ47920.1 hypothetical protein CKM354_001099700 [Cercospora kikuchii]
MAYPFLVAPIFAPTYRVVEQPARRQSVPLPAPPKNHADLEGLDFHRDSSGSPSPTNTGMESPARRNSSLATHRVPRTFGSATVRTRSLGFGAGVVYERDYQEPSDDDVIIVTVRLSNQFRKLSVDGGDELPSRPQRRSFLRRLSTRMGSGLDHSAQKEERYKAVKMPRGEYKRHFRRDKDGNYAGSEPEREWNEAELMKEYEAYQDLPLSTVLLC